MVDPMRGSGFLTGLLLGAAVPLTAAVLVGPWARAPALSMPFLGELLGWALTNLGLSIPVFTLVLILFLHSLLRLRRELEAGRPADEVAQAEHLTDTWTSLFFGVGVIWTAIGMRSALIHALGDPSAAAQQGAYAMLARLVDGGILLALSTTIVGGAGGYLMRVVKAVTVGASLRRCYAEASRAEGARISAQLAAIQEDLRALAEHKAPVERYSHEQTPLG